MATPAKKMGTLTSRKLLGEVFVELGFVTPAQMQEAVARGVQKRVRVGELLVQEGIISWEQLGQALANQYGLDYLDLHGFKPNQEAIGLIPEKLARANLLLPIEKKDGVLTVAAYDPIQFVKLESLKKNLKFEILLKVSSRKQIEDALNSSYANEHTVEGIVKHLYAKQAEKKPTPSPLAAIFAAATTSATSVEGLVNRIIERAVQDRASDIHIDPAEDKVRVRIRIDGVLLELVSYPLDLHNSMVSRLKIMANLDISEKRNAQDGRFEYQSPTTLGVDLRISTLPTVRGEKVVMRIIDKKKLKGTLKEIGMSIELLNEIQTLLQRPYGMILITGPTGSGKTTTLYSMLNQINHLDTNIITVEDPVEYRFDIINQVQVNEKAGLTFANILRNILRQDPDVLMIGEVRDHETADIAVRSSLTGHLVLSTLHTNDSVSTPNRLIDMGVEPYLLASALVAVIAQRLVRVLCTQCRRKTTLTDEEAKLLGTQTLTPGSAIYEPVGCDACMQSGYRHRIALFELMPIDATVQKMIIDRRADGEIAAHLSQAGFVSMREDGIYKIAAGITSVEEVLKATI